MAQSLPQPDWQQILSTKLLKACLANGKWADAQEKEAGVFLQGSSESLERLQTTGMVVARDEEWACWLASSSRVQLAKPQARQAATGTRDEELAEVGFRTRGPQATQNKAVWTTKPLGVSEQVTCE